MSSKIWLPALGLFIIIALSSIVSGQNIADRSIFSFPAGFEVLALGPLDAFEQEICHLNDAAFSYQPVYTIDQWNAAFKSGSVLPDWLP